LTDASPVSISVLQGKKATGGSSHSLLIGKGMLALFMGKLTATAIIVYKSFI
jgi:hypothetical protein